MDNLITEFNYSKPAIAAELKTLWGNLIKEATAHDNSVSITRKSQGWIDPSDIDPVEVKAAANTLLHKLQHIGALVQDEPKPTLTLDDIIRRLKLWREKKRIELLPPIKDVYDVLCRHRGQTGAKTTDVINNLGFSARSGQGYYEALLRELSSDEVLADLENWKDSDDEPYVRKGNIWEISYEGKIAHIENLKGLTLLVTLLMNPNKDYSPLELEAVSAGGEITPFTRQKILDKTSIEEIENAKKCLKDKIEDSSISAAERETYETQLEKLDSYNYKNKDMGRTGRSRTFQDDSHRVRVTKALDTVIKKLEQHPLLHNHLKAYLTTGSLCSYKPDTDINWKIL